MPPPALRLLKSCASIPLIIIPSYFLGHSSVTVTERYAHLAPSVLTATARATPGLGTWEPSQAAQNLPSAPDQVALTARNHGARHARFEPATFGSGVFGTLRPIAEKRGNF